MQQGWDPFPLRKNKKAPQLCGTKAIGSRLKRADSLRFCQSVAATAAAVDQDNGKDNDPNQVVVEQIAKAVIHKSILPEFMKKRRCKSLQRRRFLPTVRVFFPAALLLSSYDECSKRFPLFVERSRKKNFSLLPQS